jgi:ATP-binding cassette subfamily F protein uup
MPAPLLLLQEINLTFGVTPLLSGAELAVAAGDRICLVGRNGSGKSTLLRIAAGLVQPDAGYRFAQPGATIRYLPQEPALSWQREYSNQFCLNRFKKTLSPK